MMTSTLMIIGNNAQGAGISPWLWILILLAVVIFLAWLLTRNIPSKDGEQVEQASSSPEADAQAKTRSAPKPIFQEEDDLTKIEGIGPKTRQVFREAGITSFQELAARTAEELEAILKKANLTLGDPTSWPAQAGLAAEEKWEELAEYQEKLIGGRADGTE
jgi:predicted flap endonuclease-1-like 5' DNA nuclease